ncbi:MAG: hypothetical protein WEA09_00005 [Gemmatimonadota bacterium]
MGRLVGMGGVTRRGRMEFLLSKADRLEEAGEGRLAAVFRRMAGDLRPLPTARTGSMVYFPG